MKDKLQDISVDRYLMRAKDIVLLLGSICSLVFAGYVAVIFVVRMNDKINLLQEQISELRIKVTTLEGQVK